MSKAAAQPSMTDLFDDATIERLEGEALPERTQMSVLRIPGDTLPVVPPEID